MKIELHEYDGIMQMMISPETMAEQVQLVRLGMNVKNNDAKIETDVYKDSEVCTCITVRKYHHADSRIKKNK